MFFCKYQMKTWNLFVRSYWLCEFVRHHGGEELFDDLWTLSAAGRLRQVLQRLCGNAEETVWARFFKSAHMTWQAYKDGLKSVKRGIGCEPTSYMMVFKFCCPVLCLFFPLSFLCSFRSVRSLNTWETHRQTYLKLHESIFISLDSAKDVMSNSETEHMNLPHSYWA